MNHRETGFGAVNHRRNEAHKNGKVQGGSKKPQVNDVDEQLEDYYAMQDGEWNEDLFYENGEL